MSEEVSLYQRIQKHRSNPLTRKLILSILKEAKKYADNQFWKARQNRLTRKEASKKAETEANKFINNKLNNLEVLK